MSAIENARAHFAAIGRRFVDVREWGKDGKPLRIWFMPMTLAEKQKIDFVGEREGKIARLADALILKAQTEDGKPMFTVDDKHALRNLVDPDVIAEVVLQMIHVPAPEDVSKNSTGTPSSS